MATELFSFRGNAFRVFDEVGLNWGRALRKERIGAASVGERLETRRLLAATLSGGVLTVTGTSSGETITVFRLVSSNPASDQTWVRISGITPDVGFNTSAITSKIVVNALAEDDTIKIEDTDDVAPGGGGLGTVGYPIDKITELNGGDGSDHLFAGLEDYSGTENGYGSDSLIGGAGTTTCTAAGTTTTWMPLATLEALTTSMAVSETTRGLQMEMRRWSVAVTA